MNFGDCPYDGCNHMLMLEVPDQTPAYVKIECDGCKRPVWYRLSRVEPMAWTEIDFLLEHEIDFKNKQIKPRAAPNRPPA